MNKVILMGRLTRDPDLRYSQSGQPVCRYSLAVNRSYKREGEPDADFINIVAFAARAEFASKYFRKGMMVAVCGELRTGSYTDKDGQRRYTTDVIVSDQYFAESKASFESRQGGTAFTPTQAGPPERFVQQDQQYTPPPEQLKMDPTAGFSPVDPGTEEDPDLPF